MRLERRFALKGHTDIRVIKQTDDQPIGYLADISVGGFRVTSEEALPPDSEWVVDLQIPVRTGHHRTLSLPVICKWSRRDARLKGFNIGFQLSAPSEPFLDLVTEIRARNRRARLSPSRT